MNRVAGFRFAAALGLVLAQSDCASNSAHIAAAAKPSVACEAERIAFRQASGSWGETAVLSPADYAQLLDTQAKNYGVRVLRLQQDTQTLNTGIGQVSDNYRVLVDCKSGVRVTASTGPDQDLNLARQDATAIRQQEINLRTAVDKLFAENTGLKQKVWKALSAPPVPTQPLIALAPGPIRAKPASNSAQIAMVRKGDRIVAADDQPATGWTAITLNDGTTGYVDSSMVRPGKVSPSAVAQAAEARQARDGSGDPVVALARATRESLPQRRASFADLVEASAVPGNLATGSVQMLSAAGPSATTNPVE